jgi:predicted choloylglycine hydrolase
VPSLCETTLMTYRFGERRTMAMSDCLWGALDGVNEDGLAVALAFGGRHQIGRGFAVTLLLRYLLEQCGDVAQALEAVPAVPVNLSYNVVLVDAGGDAALVRVAPDREPEVERETVIAAALADPATTLDDMEAVFLREPVQRDPALHTWGTVYTARYDAARRAVRLLWPDEQWSMQLDHPAAGELVRHTPVLMPPLEHLRREVPRTPQVIFD